MLNCCYKLKLHQIFSPVYNHNVLNLLRIVYVFIVTLKFSNVWKTWKWNRKQIVYDKNIHFLSQIEKLRYNGEKAPYRQKIQVSSKIEQLVMFWLINKNLVKLE